MEHYETVTETVTHKKYIKTTCDICGNEIKEQRGGWVDEVMISHQEGDYYGCGDDSTETFQPDICGECFKQKIIPFLKELGVKIEYK